jgi:hypothetical protein
MHVGGRDLRSTGTPNRAMPREAPLRPGELRSARFVRPREAREPAQPRPGVSFISTAEADRERAARAAPTLPQVPRLQRTDVPRTPVRPPSSAHPRVQRVPDFDANARAARIEAARRQAARGGERPVQPAHLRAPDFDAQLRNRQAQPQPQPPRFQRPPDFRSMRPMPHAEPAQRPSAPPRQAQPAQSSAPASHPRHEPGRRFDPQH